MTEEQRLDWHLDRKFSIGLVLAILAQTVGIVWWAATISSTVADLRVTDARQDIALSALGVGREANASRITSLEAIVGSIGTHLDRIENKLDRLIEEKRN